MADLAFDLDAAAVGGDDAVADREAEAGADPLGLGGEEGLEGPAQHLGRHPGPVVGDREPHGVVRRLGPELEPPLARALLERLLGVDHQVGDDLVQLVGVAIDRRQAGRHVHHQPHAARAQRVAGELQGTLDRGREVDRAEARGLLPRHGEEALDDPGAALGRGVDALGLLARLPAARPAAHERGVADHDRERVVELVRDAGQQRAERSQLLRLVQRVPLALDLGLGRPLRPEVDDAVHDRLDAAELHDARAHQRREDGPVLAAQLDLAAVDAALPQQALVVGCPLLRGRPTAYACR